MIDSASTNRAGQPKYSSSDIAKKTLSRFYEAVFATDVDVDGLARPAYL